jgi:alpha-beta hydrolase superfamily lysophospholipase
MQQTTGKFEALGKQLFYQTWLPEGKTKAILAICHGVGEHSGRYMNLVGPLMQNEYAVWGFDLLGCGHSPGQRGHIQTWEDYRNGLGAFLEYVQAQNPGLPVFLYGHSLGAQIVLDYIQNRKADLMGVVLSATPIDPAGVGSPAKILLAKLLSKIMPAYSIDLGLDPAALSRDPQVVQAYRDDPLVQKYVSVRWGTEAMAVQRRASSRPDLIRLPVLFIHGSDDPLHLVSGVRNFVEDIPHADKQLIVYQGSLHEPHNDLEHERVAIDLINWLEDHLAETKTTARYS